MLFKVCAKSLLVIAFFTLLSKAQRVKYLNGIFEDEVCEISKEIYGTCKKIKDCMNEYENNRKNKTNLYICNYDKIELNTLICCPQSNKGEVVESIFSTPLNLKNVKAQNLRKFDVFDYETCRDSFLPYNKQYIQNEYLYDALLDEELPLNEENCDNLEKSNNFNHTGQSFYCENGELTLIAGALYGSLVTKGDRPNMAAIGITSSRGVINYVCGGSIINERFIVTAAHCQFFEKKQVNIVRVGDRFLKTKEDDDIAQQFRIENFISHPNYRSNLKYNDIAMLKTTEKIRFNKFVVPSCIDDLKPPHYGLTVAGYGETEDRVQSNILIEIQAEIISNEDCNKVYEDMDELPNGIIDTQICIISPRGGEYNYMDTCQGDSGSPLQFKHNHEVFPKDFNKTRLSKVYITSTVLGLVSFGVSCGLNYPSVYTKLYPYRDWMRSVIVTN